MRASLRAIRSGADLSLPEGLALEAVLFGGLCETEDKQEGLAAFWRNVSRGLSTVNDCAGNSADERVSLASAFGKRALALGGGGFTGYLFEIGALTALDDLFGGRREHE